MLTVSTIRKYWNRSKLETATVAGGLLVAVGALAGGSVGAAATAHADANDNKFLAQLKSEGITDHVSPSHAIEAGHMVCQKLDNGMSPTEVAYDVLNSSVMPAYHSGYFVGASIEAYCPQYTSKINQPSPDGKS